MFQRPEPEPFEAHVTIRISSGVVQGADQEKHYAEWREMVEFMRSLKAMGWRNLSFEVIENPSMKLFPDDRPVESAVASKAAALRPGSDALLEYALALGDFRDVDLFGADAVASLG